MLTLGNDNVTIRNDFPRNHDSNPNLLNSQRFGWQEVPKSTNDYFFWVFFAIFSKVTGVNP